MSYAIHIWDQPTPTNWAEAQAAFNRLADQRAALNPKFVELGQQMKPRFPNTAMRGTWAHSPRCRMTRSWPWTSMI
ncbi:MAG: hypothetical protein EON50_13845 [Acidovorax sp.]|nr:MAG: hypothetical protein EON50_13845 [Acidovorax sp.]